MSPPAPHLEFRPKRNAIVYGSVAALFGLVLGWLGIAVFSQDGLAWVSLFYGTVGLGAIKTAIRYIFSRTIVTPEGIEKRPWISDGFTLQWDQIKSWSLVNPQPDEAGSVRFRHQGKWFSRVIYDYEVGQPGLEKFLAKVRQHVRQKEIV